MSLYLRDQPTEERTPEERAPDERASDDQLSAIPCAHQSGDPLTDLASGRRGSLLSPASWPQGCYRGICHLWPGLCVLLARWRRDAFRFDPETLELQTAIMAVALGMWILFLPHHWGERPSNFSLMLLRLWPTCGWALLFLTVGGAQMLALSRHWMIARCACSMIGFWLWLFVAALLTLEGLSGPSVAIFPIVALSEAWVYLRLRAHSDACPIGPVTPGEHEESNNRDKTPPPTTAPYQGRD